MATIQKRRSSDGALTYRVMIRLKGFLPASATFNRLTDAREWAAKTEGEMKTGRYFGESKRRTLNELFTLYEASAKERLKSWVDVALRLERWRSVAGNELIDSITPAKIAAWRDELLAVPKRYGDHVRSGADANRTLAALSSALSFAVKELAWIEANPVARVRKKKEGGGRVRFLSEDELPRLLAAVRVSPHPDLLPSVLLALTTGARRTEILGLRWGQMNFKDRTITLHHGETKNGQGRSLPLSGEVVEILTERAKVRSISDDRVFPVDGKGVITLQKPWKNALVQAAIDVRPASSGKGETSDFRWHDMRHTAASYLVMNGLSTVEVARLLGHKTLTMTLRYSHLAPSRVTEIGDMLANKLGLA